MPGFAETPQIYASRKGHADCGQQGVLRVVHHRPIATVADMSICITTRHARHA